MKEFTRIRSCLYWLVPNAKRIIDVTLSAIFLTVVIVLIFFISALVFMLIVYGLGWLFNWNRVGDNFFMIGPLLAVLLITYIFRSRRKMSENLIPKDNMFIWHIPFWPLAISVYGAAILWVFAGVKDWVMKKTDRKIESMAEMAGRIDELKDGTVMLDTAAMRKDAERTLQNINLDWQDVGDKKAGFTSKFPQGKIEIKRNNRKLNTDILDVVLYSIDLINQTDVNSGYSIASYRMAQESSIVEMFDNMEKSLTKGISTKVLRKEDLQTNGYTARNLKLNVSGSDIMHVRLAYYKSNMYVLQVKSPASNADNEAVAYFFNSFQPL